MNVDPALGYAILTGIFAAGAAWGGTRVAHNGVKAMIKETRDDLKKHIADEDIKESQWRDRLRGVETKVELLLSHYTNKQ